MPDINGYEVCEQIKKMEKTKDVPIIFLTGSADEKNILQGFEKGAVDYITKPYNKLELLVRINTHLALNKIQHATKERENKLKREFNRYKERYKNLEQLRSEQEIYLWHELNNKITPIKGWLNILSYSLLETQHKKSINYLDHLDKVVDDMTYLVDFMKEIHNFELGKKELNLKPVKFTMLITRVQHDLVVAVDPMATIEFETNDPNLYALVEEIHMFGAFYNLVKNAVEHVADLPDKLDRIVRINIKKKGKKIITSINNKGEPLSSKNLNNFFEKFNTNGKLGGTGLGTTYAYHVIKAHNGKISIASNKEHGTTVTVILNEHKLQK